MRQNQKKANLKNGQVFANNFFEKLLVLMQKNVYLKPKAAKKTKLKMISVYAEIKLKAGQKIRQNSGSLFILQTNEYKMISDKTNEHKNSIMVSEKKSATDYNVDCIWILEFHDQIKTSLSNYIRILRRCIVCQIKGSRPYDKKSSFIKEKWCFLYNYRDILAKIQQNFKPRKLSKRAERKINFSSTEANCISNS